VRISCTCAILAVYRTAILLLVNYAIVVQYVKNEEREMFIAGSKLRCSNNIMTYAIMVVWT
jgi:hypothetical protein